MDWALRLATADDIPRLETLIELSVRELQAPWYSSSQMDGALGTVFGVDCQLIRDRTYFVVEESGGLIGCGGWSKRASLFGSDAARETDDALLDPRRDAARVRAFFVHPEHARRGIGRAILLACEGTIRQAGFRKIALVATLAGVDFYRAFEYATGERYDVPLANELSLPVVPMNKNLLS